MTSYRNGAGVRCIITIRKVLSAKTKLFMRKRLSDTQLGTISRKSEGSAYRKFAGQILAERRAKGITLARKFGKFVIKR